MYVLMYACLETQRPTQTAQLRLVWLGGIGCRTWPGMHIMRSLLFRVRLLFYSNRVRQGLGVAARGAAGRGGAVCT